MLISHLANASLGQARHFASTLPSHPTSGFKRWLSMPRAGSAAALLSLLLCSPSAYAFCESTDTSPELCSSFGLLCSQPPGSVCHVEMTRQSLEFLRPLVLNLITDHVNDVDNLSLINKASDDHFDDCNFDGATERINSRYFLPFGLPGSSRPLGVIPALSPRRFEVPFADTKDHAWIFAASRQWADIIHASQDFYAHSNWIEMGFTDVSRLLDARTGPWRELDQDWMTVHDNVKTSQGLAPYGWRIASTSTVKVPRLIDTEGRTYRVLLSGTNGNPAQSCPSVRVGSSLEFTDLGISHDVLNKDDHGRERHDDAVKMAKGQTRHEWCRLLHLAKADGGVDAAAVPMALFVSESGNPHPPGTACATPRDGPLFVTFKVRSINVQNAVELGRTERLNFVLSAFTDDFTRSKRSESLQVSVGSQGSVAASRMPSQVSLCLRRGERLAVTLQAWQDQGNSLRGQLDEQDKLLSGATRYLGAAETLGGVRLGRQISASSDNPQAHDMDVVFEISTSAAICPPAQGQVLQ